MYALISNGDPDRVPALIADLPPDVRGEIERLDLRRRDLSRLDTDFLLIHDRGRPDHSGVAERGSRGRVSRRAAPGCTWSTASTTRRSSHSGPPMCSPCFGRSTTICACETRRDSIAHGVIK